MSLHINRFLDRLRAAEARRDREVSMPVQDARDLHADITKLLNAIEELRSHAAAASTDGNITVELQGNRF
jgi:type II secretory pathway component PulM